MILVPLGTTLNSLPIAVLGAMPVSFIAVRLSGYKSAYPGAVSPNSVRLDQVSPLWTPFADLIPVPVLAKVVSFGDLALFAGLALLIVATGIRQEADTAALPVEQDPEEPQPNHVRAAHEGRR